jgi:hypothetical protein
MVAIPVSEEFQVTDDVRSSVMPSEKVPVAKNCWVCPRAMLWLAGVTSIDSSTAWVTVSVAEDEGTESIVAVIAAVPMSTAVASPFEPGISLTVATAGFDVVQVANDVTSCVLHPPDNVPIAVNCCIIPLGILVLVGDVAIDATADELSDAELKTVS